MNKCYFGNFQDFCKYGLLRKLAKFARRKFNLHFCQMITDPRESHEKDYEYLGFENLARFDPILFKRLQKWNGKRKTAGANQWVRENQEVLRGVEYNNKPIPDEDYSRRDYFQKTIADAKHGDVIFFNPDYGLAFADRMLKENPSRYLKAEEINLCLKKGISVLFYQETLFPQAGDAAGRLYRDVWRRLRDAGICSRLYFFESRAPSFTKQQKTATSGYFWVAPVGKNDAICADRAEKFAEMFKESMWFRHLHNPEVLPMFKFERRVGFFVDADNLGAVQIKKAADKIMQHIPSGRIVAGAMFGRKFAIGKEKQKLCKKWGLDERNEVEGDAKNQADMGLSFDVARKIFDCGIDTAVVFSGDGGFVATAREVKELNIAYWGAGNIQTTKDNYANECDKFFDIEKIKSHGVEVKERKKT